MDQNEQDMPIPSVGPETISDVVTSPVADDTSLLTGTTKSSKRRKQRAKKQMMKQQKKQVPKFNVVVDCHYTELELLIPETALGKDLFEQIVVRLDLKEVWFFGLEYVDSKKSLAWLKLKKKVFAQDIGRKRPIQFWFKPKFYPEDVEKELVYPAAKKMFLEHLKSLVVSGELFCTPDTAVLLASFALQEELGNHNAVLNPKGFLLDKKVLPESVNEPYAYSPQDWEEKIVRLYKDHRGMTKEQATMEYLRIAQDLEMFGVEYFKIKTKKNTTLYMGIDALGMNIYEKHDKLQPKTVYTWSEIKIISYRDRRFCIKPVKKIEPDFVCFTEKQKVCKSMMMLCMSNHELFVRRRKIDVAPKERHSTSRLTDVILEEEAQQGTSFEFTPEAAENANADDAENAPDSPPPAHVNGYNSDHNDDTSARNSTGSNMNTSGAYNRASASRTPIRGNSPRRSLSASPRRSLSASPQRPHAQQSPTRSVERSSHGAARASQEPEYATVERDPDDDDDEGLMEIVEEVDTPPSPPAQRPERTVDVMQTSSPLKPNSMYESITPLTTLPEEGPVSARSSTSEHLPWSDSDHRRASDLTLPESRGSRDYALLLEKYKTGKLGQDADAQERHVVVVNDNKEEFYRAKDLFDHGYSGDDVTPVEGAEKYNTLRYIRNGYARDRIAIFEALT